MLALSTAVYVIGYVQGFLKGRQAQVDRTR
jgi:hypothetical protein